MEKSPVTFEKNVPRGKGSDEGSKVGGLPYCVYMNMGSKR